MVCIACSWVATLAFKVNLCVISSRALVALVPWTTYSRPMLTSWLFPSGQNWFLLLEYGLKLCPLKGLRLSGPVTQAPSSYISRRSCRLGGWVPLAHSSSFF